ncbi:MAG: cytochrome c peroxidase [Polyangiaceae bacterium]
MRALVAGALALALAPLACSSSEPADPEPPTLASVPRIATPEDPIDPIPLDRSVDARKAALGKALFFDPVLSPDGKTSCVTCHMFDKGGADGVVKNDLPDHEPAAVNTPTIFNVSLNYRLHWSGKYDELVPQLDIPITSPRVLATTYDAILGRLAASPSYRARFQEVYPDGLTKDSFKDAIVTYERSLLTPNSRFDRYLRGDKSAITGDEEAGYALFKSHGCISCHQGVNVGGNLFQKFGAMADYFKDRGHVSEPDYGRYNVTKKEEDRYTFRVASLRNVALTAPYFHDGSAATLEDAVRVMARYQLGRKLSTEQTRLIVLFLKTLTGELDGEPLDR